VFLRGFIWILKYKAKSLSRVKMSLISLQVLRDKKLRKMLFFCSIRKYPSHPQLPEAAHFYNPFSAVVVRMEASRDLTDRQFRA
jgi:hypothetical protein